MLLGFSLTRHCNLRCPHCIRDDVSSVASLPADLVLRVLDEARLIWPHASASFTGGEPTLHEHWNEIIDGLAERGFAYRFVTNGWHLRRIVPSLDRHPPAGVRVSLSGARESTHDAERGRGSFRRVLVAVALLTSRRIPAQLSIVVDRRDRHELRDAADLAESLGCLAISYILPQPVPASRARGSDLTLAEMWAVRREVEELAADRARRTRILLDWGAPVHAWEELDAAGGSRCDTFARRRIYVDPDGRVSLCCQLSEYGVNTADIVGDLRSEPLAAIWERYVVRLDALRRDALPANPANPADPAGSLPCLRCARSLGKLDWMRSSSPVAGEHGVPRLHEVTV